MIRLVLPLPPSVNRTHRHGKGRVYRSPQYMAWIKQAGLEWMAQRVQQSPRSIKGHYNLTLTFWKPDRRLRDTDNLLKATSDFLQNMGIVENDSLQRRVTYDWGSVEPSSSPRVEIVVTKGSST